MASRIQTCFISAPSGAKLEVITDALRQRDIRVMAPESIPSGANWQDELSSLLATTDLVIGILTRERRSDWVLFELGQARALGKRILLFAPPDYTHMPNGLRDFQTVRATVSNREAIEFALDQLLAAPETKSAPPNSPKKTRPLGPSVRRFLHESLSQRTANGAMELEALVIHILKNSGVEVIAHSPSLDAGVDLAVWSDGLQLSVGNPLLIEIKSGNLDHRRVSEAAKKFAAQLAKSGSRWGLLLLGTPAVEPRTLPGNVLVLSIDTLIQRLGEASFDDVIRDLRNRRVHGSLDDGGN